MDLIRHVRFFVAVAEERHFGRAASTLGMTQPPLSQGIRRLETHWEVQLFERRNDGVRLSPQGTTLLPYARALLEEAAQLDDIAYGLGEGEAPIRVGLAPELSDVATRCLLGLRRATRRQVLPEELPTVEGVERVGDGRLDLAVIRHPAIIDGTRAGAVHTVATSVLLPAASRAQSIADLELPLATWTPGNNPPAADQLHDLLCRLGHSGRVRVVLTERAAFDLVAAGEAWCITARPEVPAGFRKLGSAGNLFPLRFRVIGAPGLAEEEPESELWVRALENELR